MKKAIDSGHAQTMHPTMHRRPKRRLHEKFHFGSQLKSYANRLRVRLADLDSSDPADRLQLDGARMKMSEILAKKGIRDDIVQQVVAQALDIAADHQLEILRRDQSLRRRDQSEKSRQRLIKQLRFLAQTISKLPPLAKGKLNKIITKHEWENFDTEMLDQLIHAMTNALSNSSPACIADKAVSAIRESYRDSLDPAVNNIIRSAPPVILELWEIMPAETRTQVEAALRNWQPPTRQSTIGFLSHLVALLETFEPRSKPGRRRAIERRFAQRAAAIWHSLGLHVGRAYNGSSDCQSTFQRFTRLALSGVRDGSRISGRQITNLKSERQTHLR